MKIEHLARIIHETHRAYCYTLGDKTPLPWDSTPEDIQNTIRRMIAIVVEDPSMDAEKFHRSWMEDKLKAGWTHGFTRDAVRKTHPRLLPFDQLEESERKKDEAFVTLVRLFY